ncbi:hypothetical protein VUR80DRAFT_8808 [Thermomyces stellatus]
MGLVPGTRRHTHAPRSESEHRNFLNRSTAEAVWSAKSSPPIPRPDPPPFATDIFRELTIPFPSRQPSSSPTCHRKVGECLHAAGKARLTCSSARGPTRLRPHRNPGSGGHRAVPAAVPPRLPSGSCARLWAGEIARFVQPRAGSPEAGAAK